MADWKRYQEAARRSNPDSTLEPIPGQPGIFQQVVPEGKEVCDFCSTHEGPLGTLYAEPFGLPGPDGIEHWFSPDWAVCKTCKGMIVGEQWQLLALRAARVNAARNNITDWEGLLPGARQVQEAFRQHMLPL
jgi:hypothetical protein